jgi:hypothetical protein
MTKFTRGGRVPVTHFREAGLVRGYVVVSRRQLALTVDLEAFEATRIELWCQAMADWGHQAAAAGLRFSHFVSMEHVARLRTRHPEAHEQFVASLGSLLSGGSNLYPHNHCVFDPATGDFPGERSGWPQQIPGYRPRASMFYDVVRRHHADLAAWLEVVTAEYDRLLGDADLTPPAIRAFRPGGWDHGSTAEEIQTYVSALTSCGYRFDSGDACGSFGDRTWRVGAPFGRNLYQLSGGLIELAPSWSLTCGTRFASARSVAAFVSLLRQPRLWASRRPGVAVGVVHFDHLFHDWTRADGTFGVQSASVVRGRIERLMRGLALLQERLGLEPATFDDVMPETPETASDRNRELSFESSYRPHG